MESLSPDDVAWVNSCLVKDPVPEIPESNWDLMQDALCEILTAQPDMPASSPPTSHSLAGTEIDIEIQSSSEENEEIDETVWDFLQVETDNTRFFRRKGIASVSETLIGNSFDEFEPNENENIGSVLDTMLGSPVDDDIFRVWDLDIPVEVEVEVEEDELVEQLNKALRGGGLLVLPRPGGKSEALQDLTDDSLDDLIAGIADLSLNQK